MATYASSLGSRRGWLSQRRRWADETIFCALVAREWRWRGCSVATVALGRSYDPQFWRQHEAAPGVWITSTHADRALHALEERIRRAEQAVEALAAAENAETPQSSTGDAAAPRGTPAARRTLDFARDAYASALARRGSGDHPECLRAEARLLEAAIAVWAGESSAHRAASIRHDLRVAALRRRWEAAERSERATAAQRALAFRRLVEAVSAAS
jgi:hypothetical protein